MNVFTSAFVLLVVFFMYSCGNENTEKLESAQDEIDSVVYHPFDSLHLQRKVFTGQDSLELNPFEIYMELELVDVQIGMSHSLVFKSNYTDISELRFTNEDVIFGDQLRTSGIQSLKGVFIRFPLGNEKQLEREVLFKRKYHAILSYDIDKVSHRDRNGMCTFSSYSIIDIVPVGETFYRNTPY